MRKIMTKIACEKCQNELDLIYPVNCREIDFDRQDMEIGIEITVRIEVYCARCGKTTLLTKKRYFNKAIHATTPTSHLVGVTMFDGWAN